MYENQYLPIARHGEEEEAAARLSRLVLNPSNATILGALVFVARERHRWMRGEQLWRYTGNGPTKAVRRCRICSSSTSWCSRWPRTQQSWRDEYDDEREHCARVRELMAKVVES